MKAAREVHSIRRSIGTVARALAAVPIVRRQIAVACLALCAACGMRSGMLILVQDGGDEQSSIPPNGAGGAWSPSSGGHPGAGGSWLAQNTGGNGGLQLSTGGAHAGGGMVSLGGRSGSGGIAGGGTVGLGGRSGSGGIAIAVGGTMSGGRGGNGGRQGTGGTTQLLPDASPLRPDALEVARPVGTPTIDPNNNYLTVNAGTVTLSGTIASACAGAGSLCGGPIYTDTSFCASGTVGASSTYKSWANVGFTVNQAESGASGSTGSLPFVGSSITVSYSNKGASTLELQLWDGSNYWCAYLPPSAGPNTVTIPFSGLNSACWDMSGKPFVSGTSIDMVQFLVPCSPTIATPFDYCFLGLTVN